MLVRLNTRLQRAATAVGILLIWPGVQSAVAGTLQKTPQIYWASDPVNSDDTVLIAGENLSTIEQITIFRLKDGSSDARRSNPVPAKIVQQDDKFIKFQIPQNFISGIYSVEFRGSFGKAHLLLNTPSIYWFQGDQGSSASPNGFIDILGRNIARSKSARLKLISLNNSSQYSIPTKEVDLWHGRFCLPASIPLGTYEINLWNGEGASDAPARVGTIPITSTNAKRNEKILNAKNLGARGDGVHDDLPILQMAADKLGLSGGGEIFLPRGKYFLSAELQLPVHVSLRGASKETVSVNWPAFSNPPPALIAGLSEFHIKDISFNAANYSTVISGGFNAPNMPVSYPGAKDIAIENITIRAVPYLPVGSPGTQLSVPFPTRHSINDPVVIQLSGDNVKLINSDLYGSGSAFLLLHVHNGRIANNTFGEGNGWYSISGANGLIFEHNTLFGGDSRSSGGGINTTPREPVSQNVLFEGNSFSFFSGNDREAITTDGPGAFYLGATNARDKDSYELITRGSQRIPPIGAAVFVLRGPGEGQYRSIANVSGNWIQLDQPFAIEPNSNSLVDVVPMQRHYLIIGNTMSDSGVAAQFYGTAVDSVIAQNTSIRTGGFAITALDYSGLQPSWYNQVLGNLIKEGASYAANRVHDAVIGIYARKTAESSTPLIRGVVVRGNTIRNNGSIQVWAGSEKDSRARGLVIEHNVIENSDKGVEVDSGVSSAWIYRNTLGPD